MDLHIRGPIFSCSGYARIRHLIIELHRLGVNIQLTPFNIIDRVHFDHIDLLKSLKKPRSAKISLSVGIPFQFQKQDCYNIGYTMFEASSIPKLWVACCNDMDEIWVPTSSNKTTFEMCGVTVPIHVIPYGVDHNIFYPMKKKHSKFIFLAIGTYIDRKGWDVLFSAFTTAYNNNPKVQLICKFDTSNHYSLSETKVLKDVENIIVIDEKINDEDIIELYRTANCFVLPTRGEAFCLPALEAITCGIPVIITENSGYGDFLNNKNSWFIKSKGLYPASPRLCTINPVYYNTWFQEPDESDLIRLLHHVVEDKKDYHSKCNTVVDKAYFYENIAQVVYSRLKEIERAL